MIPHKTHYPVSLGEKVCDLNVIGLNIADAGRLWHKCDVLEIIFSKMTFRG